jgi:protein TonB
VGSTIVSEGRRRLPTPSVSTSYTLIARGKGGESTAQTTIIVVDAPLPDSPKPASAQPAEPLPKDHPKLYPVLSTVMNGRYLQKRVAPVYPLEAREAGVEGAVRVQVVIDGNGRVIEATPVTGDSRLHEAARQAVLKYVYAPYKINSKRVAVSTTVQVNFSLQQ